PSAFSGVINIITRQPAASQLELQLSAGEYGTWNTSAGGAWVKNSFSLTGGAEIGGSDGYIPATDYRKNTVSLRAEKSYRGGSLQVGYGFMNNHFGASNAYHPKYANQYEEVSSQLLSTTWKHALSPRLSGTLMANYRIHHDMYDFDNYRNTDRLSYLNLHKTGVLDVEWKARFRNAWGNSAFGAEYRNETVRSNRLGEELDSQESISGWPGLFYTRGKSRENYSLFAEYSATWKRFLLSAGTLANINSQFGFSLFPGLDLGYTLTSDSRLYYSVNRSLRFPTFTELYLNNATVTGDPDLKPEKAWTHEIGFKTQKSRYSGNYSVFYTAAQDAIDKVKRPEIAAPLMENISDINRYGFETAHTLTFPANRAKLKQLSFNFSWITTDRKEEGFQSFYTLNYLKQKLSAGLFFEPVKNLSLSGWYTWKNRAGQYSWDDATPPVNYGSFSLVDVRAAYRWKKLTLALDVNNLLDEKYFEHGFVAQPPRWFTGRVTYRL
ncbi:MAG: TonB-dependent receptor, partial [Leadbetterella sp.]|nr:TonB-dependent receptor [Leadbetterella sp.]